MKSGLIQTNLHKVKKQLSEKLQIDPRKIELEMDPHPLLTALSPVLEKFKSFHQRVLPRVCLSKVKETSTSYQHPATKTGSFEAIVASDAT